MASLIRDEYLEVWSFARNVWRVADLYLANPKFMKRSANRVMDLVEDCVGQVASRPTEIDQETKSRRRHVTDYTSMKNSELVSAYNAMVETAAAKGIEVTPVKKFKDLRIGAERCQKLEERLARHEAGVDHPRAADEQEAEAELGSAAEVQPSTSEAEQPAEGEQEREDMATSKAKKKAAPKRAAKKTAAKKVAKAAKPKFGHDKVIVEVGACNRFKGSKAEKLYGSMARYMERHPKATVAEVIAETDYRRQDYLWDLERKTIKVKSI